MIKVYKYLRDPDYNFRKFTEPKLWALTLGSMN